MATVYVVTVEQYFANHFNVMAAFTDRVEAIRYLASNPVDKQLYACEGERCDWVAAGNDPARLAALVASIPAPPAGSL